MQIKKKPLTIDYIDGHTIDDGILLPTIKNKPIVMSFGKRYYNCLYLLVGLSSAARNLMDFLVEEMDGDNIVRSDVVSRTKFINFIETITSKENSEIEPIIYKDPTVKEAFAQLTKTGLIRSISKGVFKVNPEYFFTGSEQDRLNQVTLELMIGRDRTEFKIIRVPKVK